MLLAVDVGNSSITFGGVREGKVTVYRLRSHPPQGEEAYKRQFEKALQDEDVEDAVVASVVPELTGPVSRALRCLTGREPFVVGPERSGGLRLKVERPEEVGADRIATAVGADGALGTPVAVVDFGTATTVNFITEGPSFRGGAILPGLALMSRALARDAARLPLVKPREAGPVVGRTTEQNILSGIIYGSVGAVSHIIGRAEEDLGVRFRVAVTGGMLPVVMPQIRWADLSDPHLALRGLLLILQRGR